MIFLTINSIVLLRLSFFTNFSFVFVIPLQVNLFTDHSQVMNLECLRGGNLGRNHASVLGLDSSYYLLR